MLVTIGCDVITLRGKTEGIFLLSAERKAIFMPALK
jgi:hypothetical protein